MAIYWLRIIVSGDRSARRRRSGSDLRQLRDAGVYRDTSHLDAAGTPGSINFSDIFFFWGKSAHALYGEVCRHDKLRSNLKGLTGRNGDLMPIVQ